MSATEPMARSDSMRGDGSSRCGLLVVDKPAGVTSHDVVDRVRRRLRVRSAGHLGTLDPAASGLLLIAIGAATRCATVWQGGTKTYEGTARLGVVTSSQDLTGEILERHDVEVSESAVREASRAFVGETEQVPPMVSALKVRGQRLYRLALRGIEIERAPRRIRVEEWEWTGFDLPAARFRVRCAAGTYVRTLVHDLGRRLGCGAALQSLRRIRSEPFGLERAVTLRDLDDRSPDEVWERAGIDLDRALSVLPSAILDEEGARRIGFGAAAGVERVVAESSDPPIAPDAGPRSIAIRGPDGRLLALGEVRPDDADPTRLVAHPRTVFPWAVREGRP